MQASFPVLFRGLKFADHATIGLDETLRRQQRAHFLEFYRRCYRPDLMVFVAAGDFEVGPRGGPELVLEGRAGRHGGGDVRPDPLGVSLEQRNHQSVPVTELVVDDGPRHTALASHRVHPQCVRAAVGQQPLGGVQQQLSPLGRGRAWRPAAAPTGGDHRSS